jgi:hypothetical protein
MTLFSQIKFSPQSLKSRIATGLKATLDEMPIFKYVAFDKVRLYTSDFRDNELPAAQFIDVSEAVEHLRNRVIRTWSISLEVIHKSTENEYISQKDMWNLEYQISRKIWEVPNLNIPGVVHCKYISNSTDLHLMEPFYLLRLDFEVIYHEALVTDC